MMRTMAAANSRIPGFMKIINVFRKSHTTPLITAERIMGRTKMHRMRDVARFLNLGDDFVEKNPHLQAVPYSEEELEWARGHGAILTLHASSPRRVAHAARGGVVWPRHAATDLPAAVCARPMHPEWRLIHRPTDDGWETAYLRMMPDSLRGPRFEVATFALGLSALYLDHMICGVMPPSPRATSSTYTVTHGGVDRVYRIYLQGDPRGVTFSVGSALSAGTKNLPHAPLVTWKPRH